MTIEGNISFKGKMSVLGVIKGTVIGDVIVIGKEGEVYANLKVSSITIGGVFEGELNATTELIILSGGKCEGTITCKSLIIEPGGVLNGKVIRSGN